MYKHTGAIIEEAMHEPLMAFREDEVPLSQATFG
jgi:hypothetical protein